NEIASSTISSIGFFACIAYIILGSRTSSIGDITLFLVIFPQSFNILQGISSSITNLYHHNIYINSIFELFKLKPSLEESLSPKKIEVSKPVTFRFDKVNFSYPNTTKVVLQDISFEVKSSQIIAIV